MELFDLARSLENERWVIKKRGVIEPALSLHERVLREQAFVIIDPPRFSCERAWEQKYTT